MALTRIKSWDAGEMLTADDLNGEFDNILGNPLTLISPFVDDIDADGHTITDAVLVHDVHSFSTGDATPTVAGGKVFQTNNATPTTITMFDGGLEGQEITVLINDNNTTFDFTGTNLKGNVGVDWSPVQFDHMYCTFDGTRWFCRISDNTV